MTWRPTASMSHLRARADLMACIRAFFVDKGHLEVETPILNRTGITDVYIDQLTTMCLGQLYYLQTSPEYPMKRLLAAGSGPIFQLARVFRDNERGRWHSPEFTMLEWYQLDCDHHGLMAEVDEFLQAILPTLRDGPCLVKRTYQDVFETYVGLNPHTASLSDFKAALEQHDLSHVLSEEEADNDAYLFLLMSHVVEPQMAKDPHPTAVYDFPISQAALARIENGRAARFEVYYQGIELANGFYELQDPVEQAARFETDRQKRAMKSLPAIEMDPLFLAALSAGLPVCSGVALGVDRLLALALKQDALKEILAFHEFSLCSLVNFSAP